MFSSSIVMGSSKLSGRSATYVLAASDAPAIWKAQADKVLSGTADDVDINAYLVLGDVLLSPGNFATTAKISVPSNRRLFGSGLDITTITGSGAGTHYQVIGNTTQSGAGNANIYVADMSVDAAWVSGGTDSARGAISFRYVDNVLMERVYATQGYEHNFELAAATHVTTRDCISNAPTGDDGFSVSDIGLGAVSLSSYIYYYNNRSYGVTASSGSCFEVDDGPQYVWYIGNKAYDSATKTGFEAHVHTGANCPKHLYYEGNSANNVAYYMGINTNAVPNTAGEHITDVTIKGNKFTGAATEGIVITAVRDLLIADNYLETRGIAIDWYTATYFPKNVIIRNNITASDLVKTPIYVKDADFVTIEGNICNDTTTDNSIFVRALNRSITGIKILNNIAKNANTNGIIVQTAALLTATDILIQGNESCGDGATTQNYGLNFTNAGLTSDVLVADNNFHNNATASVTSSGALTNITYRNNIGYLAPGEIRTYNGSLAAGTVGNAVLAWQNPEAQAVVATVKARVTTGGTATCDGVTGMADVIQIVEDCEDVWAEVHASTVTLTNTTGTLTQSGVALNTGANELNITGAGTFTFALPSGYTASLANGTATVTPTGAVSDTLVIDSGVTTGTITVTVTSVVTCAVDTTYVERGTNCLKFTVPATVDQNDIIGSEAIAALDISTATHIQLKVMATTTTVAGDYQLLLDETAGCASPDFTLSMPILTANQMQTVVIPLNAGVAAGATADAIISVGLKYAKATSVANNIYIDDIRAITVDATIFQALPIDAAGVYDSRNATDAGTGVAKPVYVAAKNTTDTATAHDTIVMASATAASTSLVGTYYIEATGV